LLQYAIEEAHTEQVSGGLLHIDIDRFKSVNDSLGHAIGDALISELGRRLALVVLPPAKFGRFGADEFVIILSRLSPERDQATVQLEEVINRLYADFTQPFIVDNHELYLTVSIGTAFFDGVANAAELVRHADIAMHAAKSAGRNQVVTFHPEMLQRVSSLLNVEKELRAAIGQGQFVQYFQPQVDHNGQVVGVEALARWIHPVRGLLPPSEFIAMAENIGLIDALGEELLEYACRELVEWERHGLPQAFHRVSVNISARQFHSNRFVATVEEVLCRTGANPLRLTLELTESILLENIQQVTTTLDHLRVLGVTISIDDFGTGYSSLAYLQRLPLGELKIDRSFVQNLHHGGGSVEIVSTIIGMARAMGMMVVAEGVETQLELDALLRLNCETFQGFHFYRPMSSHSFSALLIGSDTH
jgi:diguanylate cyclase (GGDEF)-like protein